MGLSAEVGHGPRPFGSQIMPPVFPSGSGGSTRACAAPAQLVSHGGSAAGASAWNAEAESGAAAVGCAGADQGSGSMFAQQTGISNVQLPGVLSNISSITDLGGFDPVWLFLVVGGVMFILGFAGCIGALRENTFLLKFFSVFLGIIFFLELTAGVLAFVFKDWIKDQLNFFINNNIRAYRDDIDLQNLIDFTQEYVSAPSPLSHRHGAVQTSFPWQPLGHV
ncbi:hypothetical protein JZ751_007662 [Albula glossodonta]|uniref:Tetraspanin-5 n=1 Tax=Albula glossodonta TaxID=121402 RepID=A0A8T2N306_9TELE|nr:hypothetical protein JZ751_007662 [Albula glossodonta]